MTMWTVIANPWLTKNGADKMFLTTVKTSLKKIIRPLFGAAQFVRCRSLFLEMNSYRQV